MLKEVKCFEDFVANVLRLAENMSIVLLEATNTNQTTKCARDLISMEHTKVSIPQGQVSVADDSVLKKNAMSGAVHRLQTVASIVTLEQKHVISVVLVMATSLPKFEVIHVRSDNFLVASHSVLFPNHKHEFVVNMGALGLEEGATRRHFEVGEQILLSADDAVVTLLSLFAEVHVFVKLLLRGERDGVDALQTVIGCLSKPVCSRVAHHFESLDQLCGWDVGTRAQVNQIAALVGSHTLAVLDL